MRQKLPSEEEYNLTLTRRAGLIGFGSSALASAIPPARAAVDWGTIGERIAECLLIGIGSGAAAFACAIRGLTGPEAVRLHEESLRQIAQLMKQEFHAQRILEVNEGIKTLFRTMNDYRRAPREDRLASATSAADRIVVAAEGCMYGPDGYWFPGLVSFATAVSLKIAILKERAIFFRDAGEHCNIAEERGYARRVIDRWVQLRDVRLRELVTDPVLALVGGTEVSELGERIITIRLFVWSTNVEGDTITLDVDCGWGGVRCTEEEERKRAERLVKGYRDRIDAVRYKPSENSTRRMQRNWFKLKGCGESAETVPPVITSQRSGSPQPPNVPTPSLPPPPPPIQPAATAPEIISPTQHIPKPVYPPRALRAGKTGFVILRYSIDIDGSIQDVVVISAQPKGWQFEDAAIEALRRGRYSPRRINGRPVKTSGLRAEFEFNLKS